MLKFILSHIFLITCCTFSQAQIGNGSSVGNITLANPVIAVSNFIGNSSLPFCTPQNYFCNTPASSTYMFTGNGNWTVEDNWLNKLIPPKYLPNGYEILINPLPNGEAVLNTTQTIAPGGKLTVLQNKKFRVIGSLLQQ